MIYYTGDIHGDARELVAMVNRFELKNTDTLVLLGDVGANYFGDWRDKTVKEKLNKIAPTVLCIHGNHEMRPTSVPTYKEKEWNGGIVWYEEKYPSVLFAKDGEIYIIEGKKHLAIGGAYSVDKYYRMERGWNWFSDEQPSDEIKAYVEKQIASNSFDIVLTHTCPFKYIPTEAFIPGLDQSSVDQSTERWLDEIEKKLSYEKWYCGHWHINKKIDKIEFLFHNIAAQ